MPQVAPALFRAMAQALQAQGRGGDTVLAHIDRGEAKLLKARGGAGTRNPVTGLLQFFDGDGSEHGGMDGEGEGSVDSRDSGSSGNQGGVDAQGYSDQGRAALGNALADFSGSLPGRSPADMNYGGMGGPPGSNAYNETIDAISHEFNPGTGYGVGSGLLGMLGIDRKMQTDPRTGGSYTGYSMDVNPSFAAGGMVLNGVVPGLGTIAQQGLHAAGVKDPLGFSIDLNSRAGNGPAASNGQRGDGGNSDGSASVSTAPVANSATAPGVPAASAGTGPVAYGYDGSVLSPAAAAFSGGSLVHHWGPAPAGQTAQQQLMQAGAMPLMAALG